MSVSSEKLSNRILSFFYFLAIITTFLVVGAYFFIVYHYSVNIPFWDDYTHLNVITNIVGSDSVSEKFKLLFSLHNEHRIVFARLATLAVLLLEDELNFVTLIMLGNLSVLGIGMLLFLIFYNNENKDYRRRVIYFLPVVFLLFNLSYFEASAWAIAALSSLVVIFLSFLCILILSYSANRSCWWTFLAFFLGALSTCTQGNGLLVLYIGIFLLLLQKRYIISVFWSVGAAVISFLYFYDYVDLGFHPKASTGFLSELTIYLSYFFTFLGSWSNMPLCIGVVFSTLFLLLTISGLYRKNITLFGFLLFLFLSAFSVTVSRAGFGIEQALSPRYKIYSLLLFAFLYMALFEFLEHPWLVRVVRYIMPSVLIYLIVFNLYMMPIILDKMAVHRQLLVDGLSTWKKQGKGLAHWDEKSANQILTRAIHNGIYYLPY